MSRFTDKDFRFSFWYPKAWKVTDEPIGDPTRDGWFQDGTIVKKLQISKALGLADNDPSLGVVLLEIFAPMGLTELGHSKSAGPGVDQKYFFDSGTRRWMYAQLSDAPDEEAPAASPVGADPATFVATSLLAAKDAQHTYNWSSGRLKISDLTAHE